MSSSETTTPTSINVDDLLKDVIQELDYDLYKEVFIYPSEDDDTLDVLRGIVKGYIDGNS